MFELSNYKDINAAIYPYVTQYYAYIDDGDYTAAYNYLEKNKEKLKGYIVDADSFNKIELGIYNLAKKQNETQKVVVSETEPGTEYMMLGSYWVKPISHVNK